MNGDELGPIVPALLDALTAAGTGVIVLGERDGEIERLYQNRTAAARFGYTLEEVIELPVLDTLPPDQRVLALQLAASFRAGRPVPAALEFTSLHKDGSRITIEYAVGSCALPDRTVYVLIMRDGGAHNQAQLSLLEADRIGLVGALAAGFAHEINNPLTSVLLNLCSLRKQLATLPEQLQAAMRRCLDDVTTGAERIASNVRALQTLATRSTPAHVDLAAVVSASLRLAAPTLEPRAQVVRHILPVRPVAGEEARIGQAVLAMLLFSASAFEPEVPDPSHRILVAVEERGAEVVVEVSDNGRDLTADEARGAFDPFFRSSARGAGVGVGLVVARSVATNLGGEVTLSSRPGGGAVITMRLPVAAAPDDPPLA